MQLVNFEPQYGDSPLLENELEVNKQPLLVHDAYGMSVSQSCLYLITCHFLHQHMLTMFFWPSNAVGPKNHIVKYIDSIVWMPWIVRHSQVAKNLMRQATSKPVAYTLVTKNYEQTC